MWTRSPFNEITNGFDVGAPAERCAAATSSHAKGVAGKEEYQRCEKGHRGFERKGRSREEYDCR